MTIKRPPRPAIPERADIPKAFRHGDIPAATTVGDLADQLAKLPRDLPLMIACDDKVKVVVSRVNGEYFACSLNGED